MRTDSTNLYRFRLGATLIRRTHAIWLFLFIFFIPFTLLGLILVSIIPNADSLSAAWESFLVEFNKDFQLKSHLIVFAIITLLGIIIIWRQSQAYIRFHLQGIEIYIPKWLGLELLGLSTGHWKIRWSAIRTVKLLTNKSAGPVAQRLAGYRLIIETDKEQIKLSPFPWLLRNYHDHRLTWRQLHRTGNADLSKMIETSPLVRALQQRGIKVVNEFSSDTQQQSLTSVGFDITQHKGMKIQLILMSCVGLYAFIDGLFLGNFKPLESVPLEPFIVGAISSLILVVLLSRSAPKLESSVVGFLTVAIFTASIYPGLLRVNALSAESQHITYIAEDFGVFKPSTESDLPKLNLSNLDLHEYWEQYPPGTEHEFILQRGIGGFYQVDLDTLYTKTRSFYLNEK